MCVFSLSAPTPKGRKYIKGEATFEAVFCVLIRAWYELVWIHSLYEL